MSPASHRRQGKSACELIEEAVELLRAASPAALASYYLGALPFMLGLLYFWADMSRSALAHQYLVEAALGLAGLFLWMKFWQAVFVRGLRAALAGAPLPPLDFARCRRLLLAQSALQPTGLFLVPLASLPVLPLAWVFAFYQNLTVLADAEDPGLRSLLRRAARHSALWPAQNHLLLTILSGFGLCICLNWATVCFFLPQLVKMLLGVESVFTRSGLSLLNTTFFAVMSGLAYLCVDPILKAAYTLRCFYGDSLRSGEDLKADLRRFQLAAPVLACLLLTLAPLHSGLAANSAVVPPPATGNLPPQQAAPAPNPPAANLSPTAFEAAIQDVLQQQKYAWRMPREQVGASEGTKRGLLGRFLERAWTSFFRCLNKVAGWLDRWLRKLFPPESGATGGSSGHSWLRLLQVLLYGLIAAAVAALVLLIVRAWRRRRHASVRLPTDPIQPAPDLTDESIDAHQLPEQGWMKLARELWQRGELRLALRAFYLASLAHLAGRNLLRLEKSKSNREYERELRRRGHSFPELLALFGENVLVFDRIWYGLQALDTELVGQFAANVDRITGALSAPGTVGQPADAGQRPGL